MRYHTTALLLCALLLGCGRSSPPMGAAVASRPAVKLVGSSKSTVYHLETCRSAKQILSSNLITFASEADALKAGYRPCEVCKP